ncbi:hypothetical protein D3C76_714030 [compost metagenome]
MFEYRGGHAQVFLGAALLADVAADPEDPFETLLIVPDQHQAQFDRNLAAIGAQAIEQEQLVGQLSAQLLQLLRVIQGPVDPFDQGIDAGQLRRVGDGRMPAVVEDPVDLIAQHSLYRWADIVELQLVVGGEDHIADAFGEHAITLFTVAQRLAGLDLVGHVLANADDAGDNAVAIAGQGLLTNVEAPPALIVMTETQLAMQLLDTAGVEQLLANSPIQLGIVRVQEDLPEAFAHLCQLATVVTEGLAEVAVAEDHLLALHILHVQLVRHRTHDVRPEAFALEQRQLDLLAAGDIADAEDHRLVITALLRETHHQPQVQVLAISHRQAHLQLQLLLVVEDCPEQLDADAVVVGLRAFDQSVPGGIAAVDPQQLQGHLVDLGDLEFLQQDPPQRPVEGQALLQSLAAAQAMTLQLHRQAGEVEYAQGNASAFENIVIAPTAFLQHAVPATHIDQGKQGQQGAEQAEQTLADQCRQQLFAGQSCIEQAA